VIKVDAGTVPPRPARQIEVTQTLDTRQFQINGTLPLEVKATSSGLVPDLEDLLDLEALKKSIGVRAINPHEGLQVKEINTWGDQVAPQTERLWTIALDGDPIRAAEGPTEFHFPTPKAKDAAVVYQTYDDMNLAALPAPTLTLGQQTGSGAVGVKPAPSMTRWLVAGGSALALLLGGVIFAITRRKAGAGDRPLRARDVFKMPATLDGFSVVALLRRLRTSPLVSLQEPQHQELQQDLQKVQQSCFGNHGAPMSESDLKGIARKWLDLAC
ncbi:MAG: hypothetical protein ACAI34_19920, partial [Verrucomicrobium sp.]